MTDNKKSNFGLGLIFGTIIGGLTAFFLSPNSGEKNREEVTKKIKELHEKLKEQELDKKIKEIFGTVSDSAGKMVADAEPYLNDAKKYYLRLKDEVIKRLALVKEKVEDIDKDKYLKIVDEVTREAKKEAKYADRVMSKLKEGLNEDWKKLMK